MFINHIKLKNIRSYINAEIPFPEGTTLLSGDIGSGKSTILLAIEFALFGITKDLNGASLLRNGTTNGEVELSFRVEDQQVTITRKLKRGSSVTQDSGTLIVNDERKERTATELKQDILNLLQYPQELLTKSKSLVFRYTVYTPQEEMKHILLGNKDQRLDTLRRVFGIDKYKRIRNNIDIFSSTLKIRSRELNAMIIDLEDKKKEQQELETKRNQCNELLMITKKRVQEVETIVQTKKKLIEDIEHKRKEFNELKNTLTALQERLTHKQREQQQHQERLPVLEQELFQLTEELKKESYVEVKQEDVTRLEQELGAYERKLRLVHDSIQDIRTKKTHAEKTKKDFLELHLCPLCKQKLGEEHKHGILEIEDKKLQEYEKKIIQRKNEEKTTEEYMNKIKSELEFLKQVEQKRNVYILKKKLFDEKSKERENIIILLNDLDADLRTLDTTIATTTTKFTTHTTIEDTYATAKQEFDTIVEQKHQLDMDYVSTERELHHLNTMNEQLTAGITKKTIIKQQLVKLQEIHHWLTTHLTSLVTVMEKRIMTRVHHDFDSFFQKWFSILVDNDLLTITLDEEFTPQIEQNGHDIDYAYLSGGEKTAAALAYRLALNQVINNLLSVINTRELLILDEPTDGFSAEQLDRLRIVLDELQTKQIILVSHDDKIESFVDNVIKLEKNEHVSTVFS